MAETAAFWQARHTAGRHRCVLDLTHELISEVGHGSTLTLTLARRASKALARQGSKVLAQVLERWVAHFPGGVAHIEPLQAIDGVDWRWHFGLDADASASFANSTKVPKWRPNRRGI